MKKLYESILANVDTKWMLENTEKLWRIELGQRSRDQKQAAQFAERLMKQSDLKQVKRLPFPADGKTTYQDRAMPLAWDVSQAKITVQSSPIPFADPVIADYQRHPFHAIYGSVSTPRDGVLTRIITEEQLYLGENTANAMVISNPETWPRKDIYRAICDLGALGLITDRLTDRYLTPDSLPWVNTLTEGNQWHIHDDDRPMIGFTVTPRVGDQLRAAARAGQVKARVLCDGRRYVDEINVVTGIIPGREKKELWIYAHLYEPLPDDNSIGVITAISIARLINRLVQQGRIPKPRFTLRLVFGMEMYGLAAFMEFMGGYLRDRVIGMTNLDSLINGGKGSIWLSPPGSPFFGDYIMEALFDSCQDQLGMSLKIREEGMYGDDMFGSDSTSGLATQWVLGGGKLWHNSAQVMTVLDPATMKSETAFIGAWVARMLTLDSAQLKTAIHHSAHYARKHLEDEARSLFGRFAQDTKADQAQLRRTSASVMNWRYRRECARMNDFSRIYRGGQVRSECLGLQQMKNQLVRDLQARTKAMLQPVKAAATPDPWKDTYAATMIPARATRGIPFDLRKVPKADRIKLPDGAIYGPFASILSNMDGKKTMREIIQEVEFETRTPITSGQAKKYMNAVSYLTEYGYLKTRYRSAITQPQIVSALKKSGINPGDLVLLHSSLSNMGYIKGGAKTVINACLEAVGSTGTLLVPTFTESQIYFNNTCITTRAIRPYQADNPQTVWTGAITRAFLRFPGVMRSAHPTHSVAGIGPLAVACLSEHQESDPPTCKRSPLGKLLDYQGKMVWFGATLAATTFFHFLEDELDLPYLQSAVCRVKRNNGTIATIMIPKHLPGDRDFYRDPGEESKIYRRLIAAGLKIRKVPLGMSAIKTIAARPMYDLGIKLLKKDPLLMLCDKPDCLFCSQYVK